MVHVEKSWFRSNCIPVAASNLQQFHKIIMTRVAVIVFVFCIANIAWLLYEVHTVHIIIHSSFLKHSIILLIII